MRRFGLALLAMVVLPEAALAAPADPAATDAKVTEMLETAHAAYGVKDPRAGCRPKVGDEIVVCADHGDDLHVPSTAESDPDSLAARRALDGGIPRAPQFDHGSCRGKPNCVTGGWAPPPIYYVDVTKLPAPPEGSDAEAIANGEQAAP